MQGAVGSDEEMRLCAEGIERWERRGLCQRYGWTSRRSGRVAHKRAGRRLRLQGDLERFPILQRPLRSLRVPVDAPWWRHKETHLVPTESLLLDTLKHTLRCRRISKGSVEACIVMMFVASDVARHWRTPSRPKQQHWTGGPWQRRPARLLFGRLASW